MIGTRSDKTIPEIQTSWRNTVDPLVLRQFIGNAEMGWKVAWSDRMVSMFGSMWLFIMLWQPRRRRLKQLPWWGLMLFLLPMAMDGTSHFVSDLYGIGQGFLYSNVWLAILTHHVFPPGFYAGDAWGSFNSLLRLLTGVLFGLGIFWFIFHYLDEAFSQQAGYVESKYYLSKSQQKKALDPVYVFSDQEQH
jgi:uncharacterized membrane protein